VLVPDAALPQPAPPPARLANLSVLDGKGMWIWKYRQTEQGATDRIVARAQQAGLRQLWIRVADSRDGFYGASVLATLVPAPHRPAVDCHRVSADRPSAGRVPVRRDGSVHRRVRADGLLELHRAGRRRGLGTATARAARTRAPRRPGLRHGTGRRSRRLAHGR